MPFCKRYDVLVLSKATRSPPPVAFTELRSFPFLSIAFFRDHYSLFGREALHSTANFERTPFHYSRCFFSHLPGSTGEVLLGNRRAFYAPLRRFFLLSFSSGIGYIEPWFCFFPPLRLRQLHPVPRRSIDPLPAPTMDLLFNPFAIIPSVISLFPVLKI